MLELNVAPAIGICRLALSPVFGSVAVSVSVERSTSVSFHFPFVLLVVIVSIPPAVSLHPLNVGTSVASTV
jgi:hypothetical protein